MILPKKTEGNIIYLSILKWLLFESLYSIDHRKIFVIEETLLRSQAAVSYMRGLTVDTFRY